MWRGKQGKRVKVMSNKIQSALGFWAKKELRAFISLAIRKRIYHHQLTPTQPSRRRNQSF